MMTQPSNSIVLLHLALLSSADDPYLDLRFHCYIETVRMIHPETLHADFVPPDEQYATVMNCLVTYARPVQKRR